MIAERGISCCQRYRREGHLGKLLINKACTLHKLGRTKEGFAAAIRSYYVLDSMGIYKDADKVREYLEKTYNYITL